MQALAEDETRFSRWDALSAQIPPAELEAIAEEKESEHLVGRREEIALKRVQGLGQAAMAVVAMDSRSLRVAPSRAWMDMPCWMAR